ncbi:MAG TPA: hypothetical protein VKX24_13025 [Acidimicrobiia bacterium]|nr:hypothetical protein [Acidimicrobiia bacterium]
MTAVQLSRWKPALELLAWAGAVAGLAGVIVALVLPAPPPPRVPIAMMSPKEAGEWIALLAPLVSAVAGAINTLWILYHRITAPRRPKPRKRPRKPDAPKAA